MYNLNSRSEDKSFFEVLIFIVASFWAFMFLGIFAIVGLFIFMTVNVQAYQTSVPTPVAPVVATPVTKSIPYQVGEEVGGAIFDGTFFLALEEFDVVTADDEALMNAAAFFIVRGDSVAKLVETGDTRSERVLSVCTELFGTLASRSTNENARQELHGLSVSCANRNPLGIRGYSALLRERLDNG